MPVTQDLKPDARPAAVLAGLLWAALFALQAAALAARGAGRPIDGLTLVMATLTLFVGANVATFSRRYMRADPRRARYALTVGLLVASVLVCVAATDIAVLALAWCSSGVLLAALIGHDTAQADARAAARLTPSIALPPSLPLFGVPSRSISASSSAT